MNNLISTFIVLLSISVSTCFQDDNRLLYGDWFLENRSKDSDFHLRISSNNKVLFKQEIYKNPCIYYFDGNLKNDTIFYSTKLTCENMQTHVQEHKWTQQDTFVITSKSVSKLKILNIGNHDLREYIKK